MAVNFLLLVRFQTIEVAEHSRTLKEINLLHFLGTELSDFGEFSDIHGLDCNLNPESSNRTSGKYGEGPQAKACGSDGANEAQTEPWASAHGPIWKVSVVSGQRFCGPSH